MKKLLLGLFVLLVTVCFSLGFKRKAPKKMLPASVQTTLNGVDELTARQMINNFANNYDLDIGPKSVSTFYSVAQIDVINKLLMAEHDDTAIATDGVRIYFGSDQPLGDATKLTVKIFLVSTKKKQQTAINHTSTHADYYLHKTGILSTSEIGIPFQNRGGEVRDAGGSLYGNTTPQNNACNVTPTSHYLPGNLAYQWVQARYENGGNNQSAYNLKSEWFPYCFINAFFSAITNPNNHYSGLRIYLGKGINDNGTSRDVFILVPTKKNSNGLDQDDYRCLEELPGINFCTDTSKFDGGYDKGELCPFNCN